MCRGSIAPGRRTTFKGKSGIRSGPMNPIADDTRPCGAAAHCRREPKRKEKAAGLRGLRPALQVTPPKNLRDLGEQAFHLGTGVLVAFLLGGCNSGGQD